MRRNEGGILKIVGVTLDALKREMLEKYDPRLIKVALYTCSYFYDDLRFGFVLKDKERKRRKKRRKNNDDDKEKEKKKRERKKELILFVLFIKKKIKNRDFVGPVYQRIKFLIQEIGLKIEMGEQLEKEDEHAKEVAKILTEFLKANGHHFEALPTRRPVEKLRVFFTEETERLFRKQIALQTIEEVMTGGGGKQQKRTFIVKPDMTVAQMLVIVRRKLNHENAKLVELLPKAESEDLGGVEVPDEDEDPCLFFFIFFYFLNFFLLFFFLSFFFIF